MLRDASLSYQVAIHLTEETDGGFYPINLTFSAQSELDVSSSTAPYL